MNKFTKDMLLVVDATQEASFRNRSSSNESYKLKNVDFAVPSALKDLVILDDSGAIIEPELNKAYLRAKYLGEPNVYYEATFDSINRMNRECFNMYKHVAHILGATMITKMNIQEDNSSFGMSAGLGFGFGTETGLKGVIEDLEVGIGEKSKKTIKGGVQALIEEKLDKSFLQYEVFEAKEFVKERWEDAKKYLATNGLLYNEDFRNLLESRNPENGLKKFDFIQYQTSSDLNNYLSLGFEIDISRIISGRVATVLSGILGVEIGLDAKIKGQIENVKRESDLLVMGFEHSESCLDELDKIIEQYKKTRDLFSENHLDKRSVALQLEEKGLSLGEISTIAQLPVDDIQKMKLEMDKIYQSEPKKKKENEKSSKK